MDSGPTLVELCCGTASLSLWALGRATQVCGFMGSKRRWASLLVDALGCDRPARVVLVDAGPWGDVWQVLRTREGRTGTALHLLAWDVLPLQQLWDLLISAPPYDEPTKRVAQYLWLQARSAGTIPVWWSGERWESPTGSRTEAAHARGGCALSTRQKGRAKKPAAACQTGSGRATRGGRATEKGCRGIQHPRTLARRIAMLDRLPWERVEVLQEDVRTVEPIPGAIAYFDPPYLGCPRYARLLPRFDVLDVATRWADGGAWVAVSEAEPLPLPGWLSRPLPGPKPEWVTSTWPLALDEQLPLWSAA